MKQNRNIVRLNERQLRQMIAESVKRVLSEKKLENSFKSKEDMTRYRDMYEPSIRTATLDDEGRYDPFGIETIERGAWGRGPYKNHIGTYDGEGDEEYNEYVDKYNDKLRKRLATKGGQMSYDWDEQQRKNQEDIEQAKVNMNRKERVRDFDKYWSPKDISNADLSKTMWTLRFPTERLKDRYDFEKWDSNREREKLYFESKLRKIVSESIDRVLKNK